MTAESTQSAEARSSFDVVLKISERCNLACEYCYYYEQEYDANKNAPFMLPAVMEEVPRFLLRSVEQLHLTGLNVVLHGGEPLLLKKATFERLCTQLRDTLDPRVELSLGLQTNGVLIDEEWIEIFARHRVGVGVSIDGPRELHDARRRDHAGRGSYDKAVHGLRMLQQGVERKQLSKAGLLCVVPSCERSDQVLEHLVYQLNVPQPNMNFPRGGWDTADAVRWNQAVESHRKMVRYVLDRLVAPDFHYIRGISDVLFALRSERGARINDYQRSRRHHVATVSSEGKIFVDDNLLGLGGQFEGGELTVFGTSLRDLVCSSAWQELNDAVDSVPEDCRECEWLRSCRGGELFNRHSRAEGFSRRSVLCETLKMIHEEVANFLLGKGEVTVEDLARRLSTPTTVTAQDTFQALLGNEAVPQARQASAR